MIRPPRSDVSTGYRHHCTNQLQLYQPAQYDIDRKPGPFGNGIHARGLIIYVIQQIGIRQFAIMLRLGRTVDWSRGQDQPWKLFQDIGGIQDQLGTLLKQTVAPCCLCILRAPGTAKTSRPCSSA
jgi:hypothetical protein